MNISQIHQLFLESAGACTDTRKIKPNTIFFALKGDNFNGNTYADKAVELGAKYAIIDEGKFKKTSKHILVDHVLKTLQELATYHREYLKIPIIGLTGSNGKTTTKELINKVLSSTFKTTATTGNLNNHIGVPLTLLSMTEETEIGIVEMGANHQKEIDFLCSIAKPDFGYITNIGKAHLEGFGGIEGVLKGKTELYKHLKQNDKLVFLNAQDKKLKKASEGLKTYSFSQNYGKDVKVLFTKTNPNVVVLYKGLTIQSNLIGAYNFTNIAAAITIGDYFKIDPKQIKNAIEEYIPSNNRSQIIEHGNFIVILDAYNANPSSMEAAIQNFDLLEGYSFKSAFLGDMFELGKEASSEHQKISELIASTQVNEIHLIGSNFYEISNDDSRIKKYKSFDELKDQWSFTSKNEKSVLLIKGSRGMKLERILDLL
ncbi:UDP-N-acetylmuramoyl-tripeptide--D-alanyl-D-alanine ligase [Aquimarina gracilis]|uniref:UDP-N-acetylmuramoyl-tripeptide--D-alanyl-D-alanine ligase n=1 Tax=Aquimarina gracilis TaxID=874422 RepID=A0ABU5ZS96_9FLAO|nr:UDP-N-acetylmuramoyl-tripeptide--D-alanyl-D-alanine ligase [Aquimarina gracilis]MEB3344951.1 UDP-N-acetylmuramoyl-tripeptide--D-alanyl-D-alanine ligase [Aquimarina gracilis]